MRRLSQTALKAAEDFDSQEYQDLCKQLGFRPQEQFVKVVDGKIGFTLGKPDEVRALWKAIADHGYRPTASMRGLIQRLLRG